MPTVHLPQIGFVKAWRYEARRLAAAGVPSSEILWKSEGQPSNDLFENVCDGARITSTVLKLPKRALSTIETALYHSDPERFARAYDVVLRLSSGQVRWADRTDPAIHKLLAQEKAVHRDVHKMHAFVRFREISRPDARRRSFAAWFEPDHPILELASSYFVRRFGDMNWVISTPHLSAKFENGDLNFSETLSANLPAKDAAEELWCTYYQNIFNPARLMVSAMTSEMPQKYWRNLPETSLIRDLIRTAPERAAIMQEAAPSVPHKRTKKVAPSKPSPLQKNEITLERLHLALDDCKRCPLSKCATRGVVGEGPTNARLMIVGEQPGDKEDLAGRPFVGPAGQLLFECAMAAGLLLEETFRTNAVKHFKFAPRGKRRLHKTPDRSEIDACNFWLSFEIDAVSPEIILALGSTAAYALTGTGGNLRDRRGKVEAGVAGVPTIITYHPAFILRQKNEVARNQARDQFIEDLSFAARISQSKPGS